MRRLALLITLMLLVVCSVILSQSSVKNPHGQLKWDCQDCHTTDSWSTMRDSLHFDHTSTGFKLVGAHAVAQCSGCHREPIFSHVGVTCIDCHADHHGGQLGVDCQNCHTPRNWQNQRNTLELHAQRGFALTGAHAVADCEACHRGHAQKEYAGTPMDCYSCHSEDFSGATDPNHIDGGFSVDCQTCHSISGGWHHADFSHPASFPLAGGHKNVACLRCHPSGYKGTSSDCFACHSADFEGAAEPNHVQNNFPHECTMCHTIMGWKPAQFDHNTTAFPLTGQHLSTSCVACHATGYTGTPTACYSCHQIDFTGSKEPDHVLANFSHSCLDCHTTAGWSPASFDHASTGFTLTGQHTTVACSKCHGSGFSGTPTTCYSCHQADFAGATDPNHVQQGFSHECTVCHTTSGWTPSSFNHAATAFPLTGQHTSVSCASCHTSGYAGTPTDCYSCHLNNFTSSTNPNHGQAGFSHSCTDCHTTSGWSPSLWNHSTTGFLLTGKHTTATCISCHSSGYSGTATDCYSCHQTAYQQVPDPNHVLGNFDHNCTNCHTTAGWTPANFDHNTTGFPLTGSHVPLTCISCHATQYAGTPTACYACHQTDFAATTNPNHIQQGFDHDCTICHSTAAWLPSTFNHAATAFPLTGQHLTVTCTSCHTSGYAGTPTDCYACHQTAFTGAQDPNHVLANFSHTCTGCHTTSGWTPATFDHTATGFVLTGAHVTATCISCHATTYAGTPTACYACHQTAFEQVTDPNHVIGNFDHDCTKCHTTTAWSPSTFNHNNTSFPLTGSHVPLTCISCHAAQYTGTPTACYACHKSTYDATTNPNHTAALFPTDCQACHSTTTWTTSTWNHDTQYFPIYSGSHIGRWTLCTDCHVVPTSYATFECINCHEHNKTDTDSHHTQVVGYQYVSTACYNCHPRGTH